MKKTFSRLLSLALALAMVLSLALAVSASGLEKDHSADVESVASALSPESLFPGSTSESAAKAASNVKDRSLGIFLLVLRLNGNDKFASHAFLLERDGLYFLICDSYIAHMMEDEGYDIELRSSNENNHYQEKPQVIGYDDMFLYLSAPDMGLFEPLRSSGKAYDTCYMYYETNNNFQAAGIRTEKVDLSKQQKESSSFGNAYVFNRDWNTGLIGRPLLSPSEDSFLVQGVMSYAGDYLVAYDIVDYPFPSEGAMAGNSSASAQPNTTEDEEEDRRSSRDEEEEEERRNSRDEEEEDYDTSSDASGESEDGGFNPKWIIAIAVVAVLGYMVYRSNTRNKDAAPKEGTVALERTEGMDPVGTGSHTIPVNHNLDAAPLGAHWQLRGLGGSFSGQVFPLTGTTRIGRSGQCQIAFPEGTPGISGRHCELTVEGSGVVLKDLGSSYGTFTKNGRLEPNSPCYLSNGDTFTLAQSGQTFQLEMAGAAPAAAPVAVRDMNGRECRSASGRITFGRASGNKVLLPETDKSVSSNHCVLYREGGKVYLMDLGSTNGTFFSEKDRLKPNTPYPIHKGMSFFLTSRKYTYVVTED